MCVYVCICVCVYVYMCICVYVYMCLCLYVLSAATWAQLSKASHQLTAFSATGPGSHGLVINIHILSLCILHLYFEFACCVCILYLHFEQAICFLCQRATLTWSQDYHLYFIFILPLYFMYISPVAELHKLHQLLNPFMSSESQSGPGGKMTPRKLETGWNLTHELKTKCNCWNVYKIKMHQFEEILDGKVSANISFNCGLNLGLTVVQVGSSVYNLKNDTKINCDPYSCICLEMWHQCCQQYDPKYFKMWKHRTQQLKVNQNHCKCSV